MTEPYIPGQTAYYRALEFMEPYHVLPPDATVVFDLPLGRIEFRHKGNYVEGHSLQWNTTIRLTWEPVVSNQVLVRLEPPAQEEPTA
jgi:hypothetical protein